MSIGNNTELISCTLVSWLTSLVANIPETAVVFFAILYLAVCPIAS